MRKLLVAAVMAGFVAMLAGPTPATAAGAPVDVSGGWTWEPESGVDYKINGNKEFPNYFFECSEWGWWTGTFTGSSHETYRGIWQHDGHVYRGKLEVAFEGTVAGRAGSMEMEIIFFTMTRKTMTGTWRIKSATGELEGLHGEGSWWWSGNPMGEYAGKIHWT